MLLNVLVFVLGRGVLVVGVSLLLYPVARPGHVLTRVGGAVLLTAFFVYMGCLVLPYIH